MPFQTSDNYHHDYFLRQREPLKSCLLALREIILSQDPAISCAWKYSMPFFTVGGKMFCYLWIHKKHQLPYLGIVEGNSVDHPLLLSENRSRMKIMLINPDKDIPVRIIRSILKKALTKY